MPASIKNQKLIAILIIVGWLLQFALTMTGHQKIDTDLKLVASGQSITCEYPFGNAVETKDH